MRFLKLLAFLLVFFSCSKNEGINQKMSDNILVTSFKSMNYGVKKTAEQFSLISERANDRTNPLSHKISDRYVNFSNANDNCKSNFKELYNSVFDFYQIKGFTTIDSLQNNPKSYYLDADESLKELSENVHKLLAMYANQLAGKSLANVKHVKTKEALDSLITINLDSIESHSYLNQSFDNLKMFSAQFTYQNLKKQFGSFNLYENLVAIKFLEAEYADKIYHFMFEIFPGCQAGWNFDKFKIFSEIEFPIEKEDSTVILTYPAGYGGLNGVFLELDEFEGQIINGKDDVIIKAKLNPGVHQIKGRYGILNKNGEIRWRDYEKTIKIH